MSDASVKALFLAALERPESERRAFLLEATAGDEAKRAAVADLLAAHGRADGRLDDDPFGLKAMTPASGLGAALGAGAGGAGSAGGNGGEGREYGPGDTVASYRIVREIGAGGFGTVFHAEQTEPVRRDVALKVVKLGMDTRAIIARFESERQALALMEHPSICRVFDAGTTASGRPFFAMELVHGVPITRYCVGNKLVLRDRLLLFAALCRAIQHAHGKGVIHRDIKPNNVLVTEVDGQPVPKVIDFGIAKATAGDLTEHTALTQQGHVIGTPASMSPEQLDDSADVDTSSDVYSLGVLLYEMVTGVPPFDPSAGLEALRALVRDSEPLRPSRRVARFGEATVTGRAAIVELPEDLDWVVMKCLEKDRARRYATAYALARDVERLLDHEPVEAAPPSTWYRLKKLALRRRGLTTTAGLIVLALLVGGVTTWMAKKESERQEAITAEVLDFMDREFFGAVAPSAEPDRGWDVTLRTALDAAARRVGRSSRDGGRFEDAPLVEAAVRAMIGSAYASLGVADEAERHMARAVELRLQHLGPYHGDTLGIMRSLGGVRRTRGELAASEEILAEVLERQRESLGPDAYETLKTQRSLGVTLVERGRLGEAVTVLTEARERSRVVHGEGSLAALDAEADLALALANVGDDAAAEDALRRVHGLYRERHGAEHPETLRAQVNLGNFLRGRGFTDEAERHYAEAVDEMLRINGPEHPETIVTRHGLGRLLMAQGRFEDAEALLRTVLEDARRVLGPDTLDTLDIQAGLARTLELLDRFAEAEGLATAGWEASSRAHGPDHPGTLQRAKEMSSILFSQGKLEEAEPLMRELLAVEEQRFGPEDLRTIGSMENLAVVVSSRGEVEEGERLFRAALERSRAARGPDALQTLAIQTNLTALLIQLQRYDEALDLARDAVDRAAPLYPADSFDLAILRFRLGIALLATDHLEAAEAQLLTAHGTFAAVAGDGHWRTLEVVDGLATLYEVWDRPEDEARWRALLETPIDAEAPGADG